MSRNTPSELLVCYDICDPRRLQRVHRCMLRWGLPIQYSVFYCKLKPRARRGMENQLRGLIDERSDDIRVYGIKSLTAIEFIGKRAMSSDLMLHDGDEPTVESLR